MGGSSDLSNAKLRGEAGACDSPGWRTPMSARRAKSFCPLHLFTLPLSRRRAQERWLRRCKSG
eukprot:12596346-Alexandrium_andersonii.AAC.1